MQETSPSIKKVRTKRLIFEPIVDSVQAIASPFDELRTSEVLFSSVAGPNALTMQESFACVEIAR
ncbi:MAG: hypothetical protein FJ308_08385 [Planctomycetes bacterium]|nr:hypothetical protein [Planctomycetota bacterium]